MEIEELDNILALDWLNADSGRSAHINALLDYGLDYPARGPVSGRLAEGCSEHGAHT